MGAERQHERLLQHQGLVAKLAWRYWWGLPRAMRCWVDPEDLMEEAFVYLLARGLRRYERQRSMESTFLWTGVQNLFLNYVKSQLVQKRKVELTALEDLELVGKTPGKTDCIVLQTDAQEALGSIYAQASPELRQSLRRWFSADFKLMRKGYRFWSTVGEFRELARREGLTIDDCRMLLRSGVVGYGLAQWGR